MNSELKWATEYVGTDWSDGEVNRDSKSGIRYGVIPSYYIQEAWHNRSDGDYGDPTCPKCGSNVVKLTTKTTLANGVVAEQTIPDPVRDKFDSYDGNTFGEFACDQCKILLDSDAVFPDSPIQHVFNDLETKAFQPDNDPDVWCVKSPYYTRAQFCSPCAPGACYLIKSCEMGAKAFCFGHDWFESGVAPYPVFSVETNELVLPENVREECH